MQLLQHVIAGKPNASPGSMATALFRDTRYVIYGCGAKIIVFRSDFTFLQSLSHPDDGDLEVSCVAMSGTSGLIIAGYRDQIVLYLPHEIAPKKFTWEYSETLQANFLLRYLAFHPMGSFLAAGNYLVLYTQRPDRSHLSDISAPNPDSAGSDRWKAAWSTSLANDVHKAEFSPDGHFISTFSMYDRVVKIWYSKETSGADSEDVDFDFTYLLHPRSVVSTEWRYRDAKYTRVPADNVLMTLSLDNICRLWSQTTQQFPFVFHMAALINPRSFPGSNEDLTTADEGLSPVHWIHSEAINEALALREMEESKYRKKKNAKGTTNERRSRRVKEKLKDYPDMLFRIEPTGSMIVWGVQHLTSKPRCIPKVLVIMRAEDSLIRSDYEFFLGNVFVFCNRPAIQHSSIYFPAELLFLGQAVDGSVNAYIMSLDEFLGTSIGNTYLRLTYSWCGHRASVRRVTRHPNMPFVSTTGRDGELIIFETTNPKIGARTTSGLDALGGRTGAFSEHPLQAWIPGVPLLIAYEKSELSIVHVQAGRVIQSTAVVDSWIPDLAMIHLYHDGGEDVASVESLVQARYYLIGVARDTTVYVWTIELGPTTKVATTLVAANRLELSSALKYVVATDSLSTVYGPVAPLGPHLFMTVCEGDDATLWHINGGSFQSIAKNSSWVPVSRFKLEAEGVLGIYPHTFGKLAIHRQVIGGSRVEVWCNNISSLSYRKEWELTTRDDIVGLDWYFTSDGQHLLLCGHPDRVEIYGQQRRRANENLPSWSTISNFTALGTEIVAWLGNGSILVGKKDHIDIYDKWFEDQSDTSSPYNIFVGASRLNGSLPEHHPLVLIQNLIWGHYDLVKYQLSFLHRFVQLLFQSNRTIIDVPVPLWKLFEDEASPAASIQHYDSLFAAEDGQRDQTVVGEFTSSQATFLSEQLTYVSLPRITNVDQMLLVALIDTFSQIEAQKRSLDENGGRFLLFMKLWLFSQKSFPPAMRSMELSSRDVAWAYFSESQDLLIESCNAALGSKLNWKDARAFGMGYWIKNLESLRRVIESIARNQYMANDDKNPVDCSLFYIAMRKKNVLLGLWKLANAHPEQASMLRFLANDFAEERWKKAAIKNAFALLGKQRYEYAVAFFLLGDSPKDAVNVCFKHLNDPQLALVICRLFEGDESSLLLDVVTTTLIPEALRRGDRWLASVAYSIIKKRSESLLVTLMPMDTFIPDREPDSVHAPVDPELLVLFYHLKGYYKSLRIALPQTPPAREAEFICQCAEAYIEMGCPLLALQIMKRLEPLREEQLRQDASKSLECADKGHDIGTTEATGVMNWRDHGPGGTATATTTGAGPPTASEIHESIDWSQPVATQTSASLDWNQLGGAQRADQFDWGAPVSNQDDGFDWGQPIGSTFPSALGTGASMFDEYKSTLDHDDDSNNDDGIDTVSREMVGDDGGKSQAASALEDVNHALGHVSGEQRLQYELECRNIMVHQWMLAMRSIQAVYQSTTVVSLNMDVLQVEEAFRDYFERLRGSICRLSSQVSIPITLIEQMLDMRCKEMDSVITYSEFLPLQETSTEYATKYVKFVEDQCNVLSRIVFGPPLKLEDSGHGTEYHIWLAKRLLWSIVRWQDKAQNGSCTKSLHTVIMGASCTAFLAIIISRLKQKSYRKIRWLLSLCDGFFEILLGKNMSDLWRIIESIVRDDEIDVPAIVTEEAAADDNRETFDEHQDETAAVSEETRMTAELLVQTLVLQHIGMTFEVYVSQSRATDSLLPESMIFLSDAVLKRLSRQLYQLQVTMAAEWRQHEMPLEKVHLALSEPDVKELWNFLGNLVNINRMLQMALPPIETENTPKPEDMADEIAPDNGFMLEDPSINPDSAAAPSAVTAKVDTDASNDSRVASDARDGTVLLDNQVVFRTKNIIHSFSVNAGNRAIFAVGTSKEIYEIDVEVSSKYQKTSTALIPESKAPVDDLDGLPGRESLATLSLDDGDRLSATKRNLSFDSLQKALKKSMHTLRRGFSSTQAIDNGQRLQREGASVAIDSHPSLNYYLSPSSETSNSINLYHYGQKKELVSYTFKSAGRLTKIRFDPFGVRFGATDTKGDLHLWKFDASSQGLAPTQTLSCHNGPAYDFRYLSSGSFLATAGSSATSLNVCMWDTLLPQQKQRVKGFTVNEGGSHSLVYSPRHNLVISGGKRGDIAVIDVRQRICLNNYFAHDNTIRTLAIDEERDLLISGSASGEVKIWDLVSFQETHYWTPADPKGSTGSDRVGDPTCGILQLSVFDGWIYSCGIDGTLRRFTLDGSA